MVKSYRQSTNPTICSTLTGQGSITVSPRLIDTRVSDRLGKRSWGKGKGSGAQCLSCTVVWCFRLQEIKKKVMIIGTHAQLVLGHAKVAAVKNLRTLFDTNFTMSAHMNKTCQAAISHLYIVLSALASI